MRKNFEKRTLEFAFDLISLFHVQIQEPASRSTTQENLSFLQNLLNFIITKYLEQKVDDDLSVCVDEHSSCGLSITVDLSMSCDQKVMLTSITRVVFTAEIW